MAKFIHTIKVVTILTAFLGPSLLASSQLEVTSTSSFTSFQSEPEKKEKPTRRVFSIREYEGKVGLLENIILTSFMVFILIAVMMYLTLLRKNHKTLSEMKAQISQLEEKSRAEILTLEADNEKALLASENNKLSASIMTMISYQEIKDALNEKKKSSNQISIKELTVLLDNAYEASCVSWEEFETQFASVNPGFNERLASKHPTLTVGETKICALLRLDCSTKTMARLLSISVESVHTTRYRLRKKLGLSRNDNLIEYITAI